MKHPRRNAIWRTEEIMEEPVDREGRKRNGEVKRIDVFVVGFTVSTGVVVL